MVAKLMHVRAVAEDHLVTMCSDKEEFMPSLYRCPMHPVHAAFRHLHPCELAILNALLPPATWMTENRPSLRLCLSAVGQMASPMQSVWVGSCIMQQLHSILDLAPVDPVDNLAKLKKALFACAQDMFPNVPVIPTELGWTTLTYADGTTVRVQVNASTTAIELFQAEFALTKEAPG